MDPRTNDMASKVVGSVNTVNASRCVSEQFLSSPEIQTKFVKAALALSLFIAFVVHSLPQQSRNFLSNPSLFDALVISVMFSFTGSFGALLIRNEPRLAILCRLYLILSAISVASVLSILAFASILASFRLVALISKLWQKG